MLIVLSGLVATCRELPRAEKLRATRTPRVETTIVAEQEIEVRLRAVGTVRASERADIKSQVDGVIADILFVEASPVAAGDVLIRLDDRKAAAKLALARAALDSARAKLAVAEQRLARHRKLIAQKLVSQETFDSIKAEAHAAAAAMREQKAAVTLAARELEDYTLRAPFAGTIGAKLVDLGNYVERGTTLTVLLDTDPIRVRLGIPDRYAGQITPDTPVRVTPTGGTGTVEGRIDFVDPRVDSNTRMLNVRARIPNGGGGLRDGQFVEASLLLAVRRGQAVVPEEAILSTEGKTWVFIVENGRAIRREVQIGERLPPRVEILTGVRPGETVVTAGQHRLRDGVRVESIVVDTPTD